MKKRNIILILLAICLILAAVAYLFCFYLPEQQQQEDHKALVAEYYAGKLKQYESENNQYDDYQVDVAFLGDSLTDGYNLSTYYPQYLTVNRGISGETTFGLEKRLKVSVYDLKPKVAVLLIGGNNLDTMFENYESILQGFQENIPETKIVLVSLTAMGQDWAHKNALAISNNRKIQSLAQKYGYEYVDLFTPLLDPATNEIRSEFTVDGAHQTDAGYAVFTNTITPVLERIFYGLP